MGYILVMIIGVAVIWICYAASNNSKKKKDIESREKSSELKIRITGDEPVKKPAVTHSLGQESLDSIYARDNNLWMCSRCETLNATEMIKCGACGKRR